MEPKLRWIAALVLITSLVAIFATSPAFDSRTEAQRPTAPQRPAAFSWLRPRPLAPAWQALRLPASPARLPLPAGWKATGGDSGTRTAELIGPAGGIRGYLNATPRQGRETLSGWASFRVDHNRDEGDRDVKLLATAEGLRFAAGATGSCVLDSYRTISGNRYRELACIVAARSATTVIVAAAPPRRWVAERSQLHRAIDAFTS